MKKFLLTLALVLTLLTPSAGLVSGRAFALANPAYGACNDNAKNTDACKGIQAGSTADNPIISVLKTAINIFSIILGIAAVIMIVISALRFTTSGGDPQKVQGARGALVYALVGLIIAALAQAIVAFVLSRV